MAGLPESDCTIASTSVFKDQVENADRAPDENDDEDSNDDEMDGSDSQVTLNGKKMTVDEYLQSLRSHIKLLHNIEPVGSCAGLKIDPKDCQKKGVACIEFNTASQFKGVLIADPPGHGKTLTAAMAIVRSVPSAKRFSIVVAPPSLLNHWKSEFEKFFEDGTVRVLVLHDASTPCIELLKYDVVITSYNFVVAQHRNFTEYTGIIRDFNESHRATQEEMKLPERQPNLSIFSDGLWDGIKGPYLVLDEVHTIKNPNSPTFDAIIRLREITQGCVLLSGTPLHHNWMDAYALSTLLYSHPFSDFDAFQKTFSYCDPENYFPSEPPFKRYLEKLQIFMSAWTVFRPQVFVKLPQITYETIEFDLCQTQAEASNNAFKKFKELREAGHADIEKENDKLVESQSPLDENVQSAKWTQFVLAQQHACHPDLPKTIGFVGIESSLKCREIDEIMFHDFSVKEREMYESWCISISENENWLSTRIRMIISFINRSRDENRRHCKIVVTDDSMYFLDIVEIAFKNMYDPLEPLRYDGRTEPDQRQRTIQQFTDAPSPAILLMSTAAGGLGLSITAANYVVLCRPLRKPAQEEQIVGLVWRYGQEREVMVFKLIATNCRVERYCIDVRDRKYQYIRKVMNGLDQGLLIDANT